MATGPVSNPRLPSVAIHIRAAIRVFVSALRAIADGRAEDAEQYLTKASTSRVQPDEFRFAQGSRDKGSGRGRLLLSSRQSGFRTAHLRITISIIQPSSNLFPRFNGQRVTAWSVTFI
jgi:hypothetical protein